MGGALPLMLIFQVPVPVVYKYQWSRIGGFPAFIDSNSYRSNDGVINIKHCHLFVKTWLQTISVVVSSERKVLLIFDVCLSHLNIDTIKDIGVYGMVVLIRMTNTSNETKVEDLVTFGIPKIEFQNSKQSLMTYHIELGNTDGLKTEDFPCILKHYLEKTCTTVLNQSERENSGVYPFDRAPVGRVYKVDIK